MLRCNLHLLRRNLSRSCILLYYSIHRFFCYVFFKAADRLDLNITSSLISMIQNTLKNWSEDYYGSDIFDMNSSSKSSSVHHDRDTLSSSAESLAAAPFRKRAPFIPFLLRNETGT